LIPFLLLLIWGFYEMGWGVIQSKRALTFIGSMGFGRNRLRVTFSRCTGYVKRVVRFRKEQEYTFSFTPALTKGRVWAELLGPDKSLLFELSEDRPSATLSPQKGKRYLLIVRFDHADGSFTLNWNE